MNGNTGWTTECGMFDSANNIREGKFKPLKDKALKSKPAAVSWATPAAPTFGDYTAPDGDLPF